MEDKIFRSDQENKGLNTKHTVVVHLSKLTKGEKPQHTFFRQPLNLPFKKMTYVKLSAAFDILGSYHVFCLKERDLLCNGVTDTVYHMCVVIAVSIMAVNYGPAYDSQIFFLITKTIKGYEVQLYK